MPELCRFLGLIIKMQYDDHEPPHVHVWYGGRYAAKVDIMKAELLEGRLPRVQLAFVVSWIAMHQRELASAWDKVMNDRPPGKIAPLRK
jgi:hypothetical protein